MQVEVLTGPQGGGKSTVMRQAAIQQAGLYLFALPTIELLEEQSAEFFRDKPLLPTIRVHKDSGAGAVARRLPQNSFTFCDPPYPETNNVACYRMSKDDDVMALNVEFMTRLAESRKKFFWITKHSERMARHARSFDGLVVEKRPWESRRPGGGKAVDFELYARRPKLRRKAFNDIRMKFALRSA